MSHQRRTRDVSGIVLDELASAAHWVCGTSGYHIVLGIRYSVTEAGVSRVPQVFAQACEDDAGRPGTVVHEEGWPFPSDGYKTMEALALALIYRLEKRLETSQ